MKDLKKKSAKDLNKMLKDARASLRDFRFGSAGSRARNVKEGSNLKRSIAQILTELQERVES